MESPSSTVDGPEAADEADPPAGWYEDPTGSGQRYWDGHQWGRHWIDRGNADRGAPENDGLVTIGWITAILMPIVGLIVGIVVSSRNDRRGTHIAIAAVAIFFFWIILWVALVNAHSGPNYGY